MSSINESIIPELRRSERYDHITIGLFIKDVDTWKSIRAHHWSNKGFQFFSETDNFADVVELKRSTILFNGQIMWKVPRSSEKFVIVTYINELLYKESKNVKDDDILYQRLIKLIRTPLMIQEKIQVLATLGIHLSRSELETLITEKSSEKPGFLYGVKVESPDWVRVTTEAAEVASVITAFESLKF